MGNLVIGFLLILGLFHGLLTVGFFLPPYDDQLPGDIYLLMQSVAAFAVCAFFICRRLLKPHPSAKVKLSYQFIILALIISVESFSLLGAGGLSIYAEESGWGNLIGGLFCVFLALVFAVALWLVNKKVRPVFLEEEAA